MYPAKMVLNRTGVKCCSYKFQFTSKFLVILQANWKTVNIYKASIRILPLVTIYVINLKFKKETTSNKFPDSQINQQSCGQSVIKVLPPAYVISVCDFDSPVKLLQTMFRWPLCASYSAHHLTLTQLLKLHVSLQYKLPNSKVCQHKISMT